MRLRANAVGTGKKALVLLLAALLWALGCTRNAGGPASGGPDGAGLDEPPRESWVAAPPPPGAVPDSGPLARGDGVVLEAVFSSEKQDFIRDALKGFDAARETTSDGRAIVVHAAFTGSIEPIAQIASGTLKPHVFSPASSLVLPLLNDAWLQARGAAAKPLTGEVAPLLLSPVVLAMWRPMAEALGFPAKKVGWAEIAKLAQSPEGWKAYGHPEWGPFRFGHTHPEYSNSGLISVLAETYAAASKARGLTPADVTDPRAVSFVRGIEGAVVHYGKSTGFFFSDLAGHGPSYLSAAVLYENLVVTAGSTDAGKALPFPLVALYPKEGTLWADHPFVVLDAPWVGAPEREAAAKLKAYLLSLPVQQRALTSFGFRPANTDVALAAPIDAEHGADPKQPQTLLETPDLRTLHAVLDTWQKQTKRGVDVMLVFDRSGSMAGARLKSAREGLIEFLTDLRPTERASLMTFNQALDAPTSSGPPASLIPRVSSIFAEGGTALYDAIDAARERVEAAAKSDPNRIHAVVVLTDGQDNDSKLKLNQLVDKLAPPESGASIRIFTIGYGAEASEAILTRIASRTGAAYYHGETGNIRAVYDEIASFF